MGVGAINALVAIMIPWSWASVETAWADINDAREEWDALQAEWEALVNR